MYNVWALHKKPGDEIELLSRIKGRIARLRIGVKGRN